MERYKKNIVPFFLFSLLLIFRFGVFDCAATNVIKSGIKMRRQEPTHEKCIAQFCNHTKLHISQSIRQQSMHFYHKIKKRIRCEILILSFVWLLLL